MWMTPYAINWNNERQRQEYNQLLADALRRGILTHEMVAAGWKVNGLMALIPPPGFQQEVLPHDLEPLTRQETHDPPMTEQYNQSVLDGLSINPIIR